jgi:aminomethyltransferase
MGYSLYGHELDETITPLEAGLNKFIDWQKDFIGKPALLKMKELGVPRKIVCFVSESRRSPRAHQRIVSPAGQDIGKVSSGSFSPMLNRGIGLGFVARDSVTTGNQILIADEKSRFGAEISSRPLYKSGSLKN